MGWPGGYKWGRCWSKGTRWNTLKRSTVLQNIITVASNIFFINDENMSKLVSPQYYYVK